MVQCCDSLVRLITLIVEPVKELRVGFVSEQVRRLAVLPVLLGWRGVACRPRMWVGRGRASRVWVSRILELARGLGRESIGVHRRCPLGWPGFLGGCVGGYGW